MMHSHRNFVRRALRIGTLALAIACAATSSAQIDPTSLLSTTSVGMSTSNYYFAKPNELTIIVNVLGFVQRPGRYEISNSIDLINLLSLAGGPMPDGALNDVKVTRLVHTGETYERRELQLDLEDLTQVGATDLVLHPGDVIEVGRTTWSTLRDVFTVVGFAALLTTTTASVISLTRR